jgi:hypothetical protein
MDTPTILKFSHYTPTCLWRWNRESVPKRRRIKFRRRKITQKKTYNIQNTAKVWNQEDRTVVCWGSATSFHALTWGQQYCIWSDRSNCANRDVQVEVMIVATFHVQVRTELWLYTSDRNIHKIPYRYRRWSCRYRIVLQWTLKQTGIRPLYSKGLGC